MNEHPAEELLLQHYDGTLEPNDEAQVARHVASCVVCRDRLVELGGLDEFVARHGPDDAMLDAAMFAASERALAQAAPPRRRFGLHLMLLAAIACIGVGLWWREAESNRCTVRIERHAPADPLRAAPTNRFHLELDAPASVFVTALVRLLDGTVDELCPGAGEPEAVRGAVRLPPNPLLDWEDGAERTPIELLVVTADTSPSPGDRRALRDAWRNAPAGTLPPQASAAGLDARLLPFPPVPRTK